jgi:hypothetical protein
LSSHLRTKHNSNTDVLSKLIQAATYQLCIRDVCQINYYTLQTTLISQRSSSARSASCDRSSSSFVISSWFTMTWPQTVVCRNGASIPLATKPCYKRSLQLNICPDNELLFDLRCSAFKVTSTLRQCFCSGWVSPVVCYIRALLSFRHTPRGLIHIPSSRSFHCL